MSSSELLLMGCCCETQAVPCCLPDGTCQEITPEACLAAGGTITVVGGLTCAENEPFCTGPCCLPDGTCQDNKSQSQCDTLGGTIQNPLEVCANTECSGACCFTNPADPSFDLCVDTSVDTCNQLPGARFQGFGTVCAQIDCNDFPCCFPDLSGCLNCNSNLTPAQCAALGGFIAGSASQSCADVACACIPGCTLCASTMIVKITGVEQSWASILLGINFLPVVECFHCTEYTIPVTNSGGCAWDSPTINPSCGGLPQIGADCTAVGPPPITPCADAKLFKDTGETGGNIMVLPPIPPDNVRWIVWAGANPMFLTDSLTCHRGNCFIGLIGALKGFKDVFDPCDCGCPPSGNYTVYHNLGQAGLPGSFQPGQYASNSCAAIFFQDSGGAAPTIEVQAA